MTTAFVKGAAERAAKTFAQTFIATLGITATATYTGQAFLALPWETSLVTADVATLLSVVTSLLNPAFTAGTVLPAGTISTEHVSGAVVPDSDPSTPRGDVTSEDAADPTIREPHTPEHAATVEGPSVIPDGEGVATTVQH